MKATKQAVKPDVIGFDNVHTRDGIMDIILGIVIILISITFCFDTSPSPVVLGVLIPLLAKNLKKKYIYPRLDKSVVSAELHSKQVKRQWLIAILLASGLLGFILTISMNNANKSLHPLFNVMGVLISGTIIIGGISTQSIYYFYSLILAIPMIVLQFSHGLWLGMAVFSAIIVVLIMGVVWLAIKQRQLLTDVSNQGYEKVTHAFLAEAGWIFFVYFLLSTYAPEFAGWVRSFVSANAEVVFGNVIAFVILLMGTVYKTTRFYFYAVVLSLSLILYGYMYDLMSFPQSIILISGLMMLTWGSILLHSFVARYPLLSSRSA